MRIQEHKVLVFDTPCQYNIIFGSDFLTKVGMKINYDESVVEYYDSKLPLQDPKGLDKQNFKDIEYSLYIQVEGRG